MYKLANVTSPEEFLKIERGEAAQRPDTPFQSPHNVVSQSIETIKVETVQWITFVLALGNAADAVEVLSVGTECTFGVFVCKYE